MIIEQRLNLGRLLYLMPSDATYHDAEKMRALLIRDWPGCFTESIPRPAWDAMVSECMSVIDCAAIERRGE